MSDMLSVDDPEQTIKVIDIMKTEIMHEHLTAFSIEESKQTNVAFWFTYIEFVSILLMCTRSLCDGLWDLYLASFARMLPYLADMII